MAKIHEVEEVLLSLEEDAPENDDKKCILEITKPDGNQIHYRLDGLHVADLLSDIVNSCGIKGWDQRSGPGAE